MIPENEVSETQEVVQDQSDQTEAQHDAQDNALSKEQAYAKKMRQRAQAAEEKLAKYEKSKKEKDEKELAEQGKYKEMYEKLKSESNVWKKNSDDYMQYQKSEKSILLEQLPEEDRELFNDLNLSQLKKVVSKVKVKPTQPKVVHGNIDSKSMEKSYDEMTDKERKENWGAMVNNYFQKDQAKK